MPVETSNTESARLHALYRYDILDTPPETAFDEITELTSVLFNIPVAVINFIDQKRQWFKSETGLGVRETPIASSFCVHALMQDELMVVEDATKDERFSCNPLVMGDPNFRFYAGALLKSTNGQPIGTLCVLDYQTRTFTGAERHTLRVLANQVMAQLEQRRMLKESEANRARLAELNQQLQDRDQSKDEFLAMVSHELRNPLSPIIATLDLLEMKGPYEDTLTRGLGTIRRQSRNLIRLVDDLMDASRVATGKISLKRQDFNLGHAVRCAVETVQTALKKKQQSLTVTLLEQNIILHADEVRICQVLTNLLTNAVRYTPEQGQIELTMRLTEAETVELTVADNGQGLSAENLERIFDSFVQVHQANRRTGGLGIGLYLCKHIVNMHGGTLKASSQGLGQGSRFTVLMPLAQRSSTEVNAAQAV